MEPVLDQPDEQESGMRWTRLGAMSGGIEGHQEGRQPSSSVLANFMCSLQLSR
jgi:hypothetical protein